MVVTARHLIGGLGSYGGLSVAVTVSCCRCRCCFHRAGKLQGCISLINVVPISVVSCAFFSGATVFVILCVSTFARRESRIAKRCATGHVKRRQVQTNERPEQSRTHQHEQEMAVMTPERTRKRKEQLFQCVASFWEPTKHTDLNI